MIYIIYKIQYIANINIYYMDGMKVKYVAPRIIETAQVTLNFRASGILFVLVVNSLA